MVELTEGVVGLAERFALGSVDSMPIMHVKCLDMTSIQVSQKSRNHMIILIYHWSLNWWHGLTFVGTSVLRRCLIKILKGG